MKYLTWLVVIVLVVMGVKKFLGPAKPTTQEVEPKLRAYLSSGESNNCSGSITVNHLSDVSLGEFNKQMGGWPVYASHEETCFSGSSTFTYKGRDDATKAISVAFARKATSGEVEIFLPEFFIQARRQMQEETEKALGQMFNSGG